MLSIFPPTPAGRGRHINAMIVRCTRDQNQIYGIACRFDYR